jgi:hypothetical protein
VRVRLSRFSDWSRYWDARRSAAPTSWWPGWSADVVNIRMDALVSRRRPANTKVCG